MSILFVAVGAALLYAGGEVMIAGAVALARRFEVSSLVVGLTVVAFATSAPELAATATAALRGSSDIALGNVIGSNIANVGLILGASALIAPLASNGGVRRQAAFMLVVTIVFLPLLAEGTLMRWEGLLMLGGLAFFLFSLLQRARAEQVPPLLAASGELEVLMKEDVEPPSGLLASFKVVLGIALLIGGAQALVAGASDVARHFGVSERVIGLSLVAFGTSLPELATCVVAARRREDDIVLGNVIGSNIFNLLFILGTTVLIHPIAVAPGVMQIDYWVMLATSLLVVLILGLRRRILRLEGAVFLLTYLVYVAYIYR
ncbi:MAG: sodium:calcium antiporter [Acidobacteria bacterium]|nr:MAG: sodium:calcium antiporter [Acidobacteriota bacterium]